jgi:hypothetical protein
MPSLRDIWRSESSIVDSAEQVTMIETDQIIFLVVAIIAFGALASAPSWWTAILLVVVLGAWAFSEIRKKGQRK